MRGVVRPRVSSLGLEGREDRVMKEVLLACCLLGKEYIEQERDVVGPQ